MNVGVYGTGSNVDSIYIIIYFYLHFYEIHHRSSYSTDLALRIRCSDQSTFKPVNDLFSLQYCSNYRASSVPWNFKVSFIG